MSKDAPATAAAPEAAPNAVQQSPDASNAAAPAAPAPQKGRVPAWLTMQEADFEAYVVTAKIGAKSKRAEEMRERRADYELASAAADEADESVSGIPSGSEYSTDKPPRDPDALPPMFDPSTSNEALQPMKAEDPRPAVERAVQAVRDRHALAKAAEDLAQGAAQAVKRRKTKAEVVQAAIALDRAPPEALRTRFIDPKMIDVQEGWNARFDYGDIEELANSIRSQKRLDGHGLINDIRVREKADGRYALVDGERRLHSVMYLMEQGEEFAFGIPAKVEAADAEDADLLIKMFTANMGKQFLPIEEAHYYKRLRDQGLTIAQIEEKTGRSDNSIVGALALLEADEDLVEAVTKGVIGGGMAKSIAVNVRGNKARQKELVAKAKAAKNDPHAMKAVKKEIDEERKAKFHKRTGKEAKGRFDRLGPQELADLGTQVGLLLKERMEAKGMPFDADLSAWVAADPELQLAATFGALQALKASAGLKKVDVQFNGKKGD